ncbi:hypothetical protein OROMI_011655 [Orobanche minor]
MKSISGVFHYRNSKVKDKANGLLQEILEIETKHQKPKKSDELLDHFSSRKQIEKQNKLLKKLSVEELYLEVEELIAKISPIDNDCKMVRKATNYISSIVRAMIRTRMEFWRRYKECMNGIEMVSALVVFAWGFFLMVLRKFTKIQQEPSKFLCASHLSGARLRRWEPESHWCAF